MFEFIKKALGVGPALNYPALLLDGAQIVDVRSPGEFGCGHIKNSVNIPLPDLSQKLSGIRKDKVIIVCCASGARSASARRILLSNGYSQVHDGGGWRGLQRRLAQ